MRKYVVWAGGNKKYAQVSSKSAGFELLIDLVDNYVNTLRESPTALENAAAKWDMFLEDLTETALKPWLPADRGTFIDGPDGHLWGVSVYDEWGD